MAINDRLKKLNDDLLSAYDQIESMGGTLPNSLNSENLASAIETIPQGQTWGDEEAQIYDYGVWRKCTSLRDSKICANSQTKEIVCDDGTTYNRSTFNLPVYLNPNLTSINSYFLGYCTSFNQLLTLPETITDLGNAFMYYCSSFNQPLTLPNSIQTIKANFLHQCSTFNQPLTLPNSIAGIGEYFLARCSSFNQPLTLPNSLTLVGMVFMGRCNNMISTINIQDLSATIFSESQDTLSGSSTSPMYLEGIEIIGTNKTDFLSRFPNMDGPNYYRKLY